MNDDEKPNCLICEKTGKESERCRPAFRDILYLHKGEPFSLHFCYLHSVEYFLTGQANFLVKYNQLIFDFCESVDDPVKQYLQELEKSLSKRKNSPWWKPGWF